ncbi:MAG: hypothetical protein J6Z00_01490, partial [Clostridia bacterium]|nr:hypothetical protein [Clostridia bacterium]
FLNKSAREKQIDEASKAGFTGVLFEIKDADGILYYSTSSATAKKNEAIASTAISKEDFKDFLNYCEKQSITCIPRMNCFKDKTAAYKMASARVLLQGEPKYIWLDNTAANGGKPWLNPYSPDAQSYLQDFIKELHDLGCKAICLDTVQFPEVTYLASYGNTKFSSLSMLDVLSKFVTDSQKLAGDCQLIVSAAGLSTFSDSTAIYGGNPLNFGAKIIAPELYPSYFGKKRKTGNDVLYSPGSQSDVAVERSLSQITLRVKLMDKKKQPAVLPFIQGFFYSNTQSAAEIKAATKKNPSAGFILYTYDGIYDFDQYGLKKN